jgi:SAM-dependent methyltransferase
MGATAVPGVWVAGNVADPKATVVATAAAGMTTATAIHFDLVTADVAAAVEQYRQNRKAMFERAAWEERYQSKPAIWSGNPNVQLVAEASDLKPGRALDVGSGEGADAVWLAARGWQVTGIDIAQTALDRAAAHADAAGPEVAERISWHQVDLRHDAVPAGPYDLVSVHFMHLPVAERTALYARLADAVAVGGTLLIVGHHPSDLRSGAHRPHFPDMMFTAEQLAADLDPADWDVLVTDTRPRTATGHEGETVTINDAVLVARRRSG